MKTSIIMQPTGEPITRQEAKVFLKITHDQEDDLIQHFIKTARKVVEGHTRRKLLTQTVASILPFRPNHQKKKGLQRVWTSGDRFALFLPRGPVQKVTKVECLSEEGVAEPVRSADYHVHPYHDPALFVTADNKGWGLRITYEAGYGDAAEDVPAPLRQALFQMVAQLHGHRDAPEGRLIKGVEGLLAPYKLPGGVL
ncbi:head-tail connector protein [Alphaproteobacteria bacterium]|jgi:uncharacterized phiE125 gp8 family phage protein|nr:head-tail connector protein [Alphaproteobacteria bacterium]